jgi:signal transduction histidine kinase
MRFCMAMPTIPNKRVNLTFEQTGREMIVTITDEGKGFVPEEVPDPLAPENLLKSRAVAYS